MFRLKGILGIVFGLLWIVVPGFAQFAFLSMFGLFIIATGFIAFFFAVTSKQTDTMFWLLISGGIIVLGILTFLNPRFFAVLFAFIIAGWALITGLLDLQNIISSDRKFYAIMAGLSCASLALIVVTFYFMPSLHDADSLSRIFGFYAVVFGIFSFIFGELIIRGRIPEFLFTFERKA